MSPAYHHISINSQPFLVGIVSQGVGFQQVHQGFLVTLAKYSRPHTEGSWGTIMGPPDPMIGGTEKTTMK